MFESVNKLNIIHRNLIIEDLPIGIGKDTKLVDMIEDDVSMSRFDIVAENFLRIDPVGEGYNDCNEL